MDLSPYPLPDTFEDVDVHKAFPGLVVGSHVIVEAGGRKPPGRYKTLWMMG